MKEIKLKITGLSPLLMHSDRMSNPLDAITKAHKVLTSKRKKTDEDHVAIAKSEWMGSLYHDPKQGLFLPSQNVMSSIRGGAKLNKLGTQFGRAALCLEERLTLATQLPKDLNAAWEMGQFTDARSVVVQRARLMRYRPRFDQWSTTITIHYAPDVLDKAQIIQAAENAGRLIGIGDFRPEKSGIFGRFQVEEA